MNPGSSSRSSSCSPSWRPLRGKETIKSFEQNRLGQDCTELHKNIVDIGGVFYFSKKKNEELCPLVHGQTILLIWQQCFPGHRRPKDA